MSSSRLLAAASRAVDPRRRCATPAFAALLLCLPQFVEAQGQGRAQTPPQAGRQGQEQGQPRAGEQGVDIPAFAPMPVPRALVAARGGRNLMVDGGLQDWPPLPPLLLDDPRQISGSQVIRPLNYVAWRGESDLAARVFLLWDEKFLWLAAVVRDDWHRPLAPKTPLSNEIPPADSLLLTFDPRRDTRAIGRDEGRQDDREFWIADVGEHERRIVLWDRFRGLARWVEGGALAISRDEKGKLTTYEACIPWTEILPSGTAPQRGTVLDLQVVVDDYDEITDPMPQTRAGWTFGVGPRVDPGTLGSIMLVDSIDPEGQELPDFPSPAPPSGDAVAPVRHWVRFVEKLQLTPPVVLRDRTDPAAALGLARLDALEALEHELAQFPRVDFLELQQRIHRRMVRETEGTAQNGLPFFWRHAFRELLRRVDKGVPEKGYRLSRLPQGGWLVTSRAARFAIDPAGQDVEQLAAVLDAVLLTDPADVTKRNDQLLLRMAVMKRRVLLHMALHLPAVAATDLELVVPGQSYDVGPLRVDVIGSTSEQEKLVSRRVGYRITWPDGSVLVHGAYPPPAPKPPLAAAPPADALLLPADAETAPAVADLVRTTSPRLVVVDGALQCASAPGPDGRVRLKDVFELQGQLAPTPSVLLAPGESIDVAPGGR